MTGRIIEHVPKIWNCGRFSMKLARVPAIADGRNGRRVAGAILLLVSAVLVVAPSLAEETQDPYSATVRVDATSDSAAAARAIARTDGQRRALDEVVQQLSGSTDLAKMPKLEDQTITGMVDSFEVANEKMSTVRYIADYTFHFRQAKVRQLMRAADIPVAGAAVGGTGATGAAAAEAAGRPMVVVPVYHDGDQLVLWDDPNPWREAWGQVQIPSGPARLILPLGGVGDLTAIDAEQARSGDEQALMDIERYNDADEALVAVATARQRDGRLAGLEIMLKRYRAARLTDSRSESIDTHPGEAEGDFFKRAVTAVAADIEHGGSVATDKETSLAATIPINSLGDWVELRRRLTAVPQIRAIDLLSLSRHQVKVVIKFVGQPDELKSSLAEANLDLNGPDPDWHLMPAGGRSPN
jgi:hypothetical protein